MRIFLFILFFLIAGTVSAQFFGPQKKPYGANWAEQKEHFKMNGGVPVFPDTSISVFRPVANVAAFTIPGYILMTGTGISFQRLHWNWTTGKWYCNYSISAMGWVGSSLGDSIMKSQTQTFTYGIMVGVKNNLIMLGPAINNGKLIFTIAIGISLNN